MRLSRFRDYCSALLDINLEFPILPFDPYLELVFLRLERHPHLGWACILEFGFEAGGWCR